MKKGLAKKVTSVLLASAMVFSLAAWKQEGGRAGIHRCAGCPGYQGRG